MSVEHLPEQALGRVHAPMHTRILGGTGVAALHQEIGSSSFVPSDEDVLRAAYFGYHAVEELVASMND